MIVVDASIVVKLVVDEPDSEQATRFLLGVHNEVCGPDVLTLEVCRAWVAAANARRLDASRARFAVRQWLNRVQRGDVRLHPTDAGLMTAAVDLAITLGHPLADCLYLVLADRLGCPLVTADAKFRDRVADPARVRLLAELN